MHCAAASPVGLKDPATHTAFPREGAGRGENYTWLEDAQPPRLPEFYPWKIILLSQVRLWTIGALEAEGLGMRNVPGNCSPPVGLCTRVGGGSQPPLN